MEFCEVPIGSLSPDPKNPRTHSRDNLEAIRHSIKTHGQVEPLVVQQSRNMVIAGNARLGVMKELKYKTVKIVRLDVTDTDARKLSISLNRSGELASWDEAVLTSHLEDLAKFEENFNVHELGFSKEQMEELMAAFGGSIEELDFSIPEDEEEHSEFEFSEDEEDSFDEEETNIRMVQLFFNDTNFPEFQQKVKAISSKKDFVNITDAVFYCIKEIHDTLE